MEFEKLGLGALKAGARMKILREDPFSGETTYISASIAYRVGTRAERHPVVLMQAEHAASRRERSLRALSPCFLQRSKIIPVLRDPAKSRLASVIASPSNGRVTKRCRSSPRATGETAGSPGKR